MRRTSATCRASVSIQKVRDATGGVQRSAQGTGRVGFAQFAEQHAQEDCERGGEEPGKEEEDEIEEVPVGQKTVATSEPRQKRTRVSKKWNILLDLVLAQKGLKHEVWKVPGALPVKEKWAKCLQELKTEEPHCRVFGGKTDCSIVSRFDCIVGKKSAADGEALRESGGGTARTSSQQESESQQQMKIELDKTLIAIVDAKASAKQDSAATKQKKAVAIANNAYMGRLQVAQGNTRCGPGARAPPFGEAVRADEQATAKAQASASGGTASGQLSPMTVGGPSSGRSSPTKEGSPSSGRSSPTTADGTISVPPLGNDLAREMVVPSITHLASETGATNEEVDRFLNAGFTYELLPRDKATAMMARVLTGKLRALRDDSDVDDFMAEFDGGSEVPGIGALLLRKLCDHYGVSVGDFCTCDEACFYTNGWLDECAPSATKFDLQTERLAKLLIPGPACTPTAPSNTGGAAPGDAITDLGPSRKSNDGVDNRGGKIRKNVNELTEEGIERFMREQVQAAQKLAERKAVADEAKRRQWMLDQLQHDRQLRKDELEHQRLIRADERAAERAERNNERAHQLEMMKLQLQLAQAQAQNQGSS
ncbi:unnamed protein product [Scytosiphon promiscuus]